MSLTSRIQLALSKAFDSSLSDAITSFQLQKKASAFDAETNTVVDTITTYTSRGIFARYKVSNLNDTHIQPNDVKLIILQHELDIEPSVDDIIIEQNNKYLVIRVTKDPVAATWTLQCRQ